MLVALDFHKVGSMRNSFSAGEGTFRLMYSGIFFIDPDLRFCLLYGDMDPLVREEGRLILLKLNQVILV